LTKGGKKMQDWFYILMGSLILAGLIAIIISIIIGKKVKAKGAKLLQENSRNDALAQSECMIRNGAIQCPGIAIIAGGEFIVHSVFDERIVIPLENICVKSEGPGLGKYGWFGKRVFFLETPKTVNLAIGVKDPEPWREAFRKK